MRIWFSILGLVLICGLAAPAKADTFNFDFSFTTVGGGYSGSGSFVAMSQFVAPGVPCSPAFLCITSLDGQVNGSSMLLDPGHPGSNEIDYTGPVPPVIGVPLIPFTQFSFLFGGIHFSVDGQEYEIWDNDVGGAPPAISGLVLSTPDSGILKFSSLVITPTAPVSTPEPSVLILSVIGLAGLVGVGLCRNGFALGTV